MSAARVRWSWSTCHSFALPSRSPSQRSLGWGAASEVKTWPEKNAQCIPVQGKRWSRCLEWSASWSPTERCEQYQLLRFYKCQWNGFQLYILRGRMKASLVRYSWASSMRQQRIGSSRHQLHQLHQLQSGFHGSHQPQSGRRPASTSSSRGICWRHVGTPVIWAHPHSFWYSARWQILAAKVPPKVYTMVHQFPHKQKRFWR